MILHILSKLLSYIGSLALALFLWWLIHPDSFDKLILHICRLMAFISKQHRKRYISKYIEHDMTEALRRLEKAKRELNTTHAELLELFVYDIIC